MSIEFDRNHLTAGQVNAWRERRLGPVDLLRVDRHLAGCEQCRRSLAAAEQSGRAFLELRRSLRAGARAHPDVEELQRVLDVDPDDETFPTQVAVHAVGCPSCRGELNEIRRFRAVLQSFGPVEHLPQRAAATLPEGGRRSRFAATLGRWALMGAAGVVCGLLVFRWGPWSPAVTLSDGGERVALLRGGGLTGLPALAPELEHRVKVVLRTGHIEPSPALMSLRAEDLSAGARRFPFVVEGPGGKVVRGRKPRFRWALPAGAVGCRVTLVSVDGVRRLTTKRLTEDEWEPKKPLDRGRTYSWQVTAVDSHDRPLASSPTRLGTARFRILGDDEAAELLRLRETLGRRRLPWALALIERGLVDEAVVEIEALADENPGSPTVESLEREAHQLLKL